MQTSALFDRGASRYDLLVGLNPGYHAELRRAASALAGRATHHSTLRLIDLACGSGASTQALLEAVPDATVLGLDASAGMLAEARAKDWPEGVRFAQATAGELDVAGFEPGTWDGIQAAYLYRNVPLVERDAALAEAFALLAPGGWLVAQDYSVAGRREARWRWHLTCWLVIIPLGVLLDHNFGLYRYLWRSVLDFDSVQAFGDRLATAGFTEIARQGAGGWQQGILHTFVARKPA
jgi:ubiquinone/menaquinone biosynthesis C-methylase UbiE